MSNRIIKFRMWSELLGEMTYPDNFGCLNGMFGWTNRKYLDVGSCSRGGYESTERCVLMQSTGKFDMKGIEIYESDIMRFISEDDDYTFEIKWFDDYDLAGVNFIGFVGVPSIPLHDRVLSCEVIGNRYQNPELLRNLYR